MGRTLVVIGVVLVALGLMVIGLGRLGVPLGKLPGDIFYRGKGFQVVAPLGTSLLFSVLLSLLLYALARLRR